MDFETKLQAKRVPKISQTNTKRCIRKAVLPQILQTLEYFNDCFFTIKGQLPVKKKEFHLEITRHVLCALLKFLEKFA